MPLDQTSLALFGPGCTPLNVIDQFLSKFTSNGRTSQHTVFVIKGLRNNLLGFPAITNLNMAVRVDNLQAESKSYHNIIVKRLLSLFDGLGELGEPYEIKLIPNSKPYALYTPRRVPLPLRE